MAGIKRNKGIKNLFPLADEPSGAYRNAKGKEVWFLSEKIIYPSYGRCSVHHRHRRAFPEAYSSS